MRTLVILLFFISLFHRSGFAQTAELRPVSVYPHLDSLLARISHPDTTYLINFWATWCKPCVAELPLFEQLDRKLAGTSTRLLLVSLDFASQIQSRLVPFLAKRRMKQEVAVLTDPDANRWINGVSPDWSGAIPATWIYRSGPLGFHEGEFSTLQEIEEFLQTSSAKSKK